MRNLILSILVIVCSLNVYGQQHHYWVYLAERTTTGQVSAATIENRLLLGLPTAQQTDCPPAPYQLSRLEQLGLKPRVVSNWLNAVSVTASQSQVEVLKQLPFVKAVEPFGGAFFRAGHTALVESNTQLFPALAQMNAGSLINAGLTGKGIKMGLIDAGFRDADLAAVLRHKFKQSQVKAVRDFVVPNHTKRFFRGSADSLDTHGATVFKMTCGYDSVNAKWLGCATGADFWLARTDNAAKEFRMEEDYWLKAMEWMDSAGVRLINSSLGYGKGFDDPRDDYKPTDMTGKTTAVSKAAGIAVNQKGLMLVISAGNEGDDPEWGVIASPGDVEGVLTVGATLPKPYLKANYSGVGPASLPYVKPDVAAYSLTGTSFSAPVVAGVVACLMEANPKLKNRELVKLMQLSGSLHASPNNYLGYGIPDAGIALKLATSYKDGKWQTANTIQRIEVTAAKSVTFNYAVTDSTVANVVAFYKKDGRTVLKQTSLPVKTGRLEVPYIPGAVATTLMLMNQVVEINWKD